MKRLRFGLTLFALVALLASPIQVFAQEDPESVFRALVDAVNAQDADAVAALFADDATLTFTWGDESETATGKDQIREDFAEDESADMRVEIADLQVDGDRVRAKVNVHDGELEAAGVSPAIFNADGVVQAGKLTSLTLATDPEWVARAEAAMGPMEDMASETPDAMAAETPTADGPGPDETPAAMTEGDQDAAMGNAGAEGGQGPGKLPASGSDTTNWLLVSLLGILGLGGLGAGAWMRRAA